MKKVFIILSFLPIALFAQHQVGYLQQLEDLSRQPESAEKYQQIGKLYMQTGNYNQACHNFNKSLIINNKSTVRLELANAFEKAGFKRKAILEWQKIIAKDSTNDLARYRLAKLFISIHKKDNAFSLLTYLHEKDARNPNYPYLMAKCNELVSTKIKYLRKAYQIDNRHIKSIQALAIYYNTLKMYDSTMYFVQNGLQLQPENERLLRLKTINLYRKHQFKSMLHNLQKMNSLGYGSYFVYKNMGLALMQLHKYNDAEKYFNIAHTYKDDLPELFYYKALLYKRWGKFTLAKKNFKISLALKKPDTDKEYYQLGMMALEENKLKTAMQYFKRALNNNPNNPNASLQIAHLTFIYLKQPKIALDLYRKYLAKFEKKYPKQAQLAHSDMKKIESQLFMGK